MRGMLRGKSNEGHRYTHRKTKMMNDMLRKFDQEHLDDISKNGLEFST